jgi:hypothetical protein
MVFTQKLLAPGPGIHLKATFRQRSFPSALGGFLISESPALPEAANHL